MEQNNMTTKERILHSALTLFAENGYDGVGVDLIASAAGIKGPSLYKHFKGKEGILDALIEQSEVYYENNFGSERKIGKLPDSMAELSAGSMARIIFTIDDPTIRKIRRLLAMEQFRNERIAKLADLHGVIGLRNMYEKIFSGMMDKGIMKKEDPGLLAMVYIAPIALHIQMCDRFPEKKPEILQDINRHLIQFEKEYGI